MKYLLSTIELVIMYKEITIKNSFFMIPIMFTIILGLINIIPIYSTIIEEEFAIAINDPKLKIEVVEDNIDSPNNIAFLANNDILVYEESGNVKRITDGETIKNSLLEFHKLSTNKIIMKAIIAKEINNLKDKITHDVFFYYIECNMDRDCTHKVNSFQLDTKNQELINSKNLLSILSFSEPSQINGILRVGNDHNLHLKLITNEEQPTKYLSENKNNSLECLIQPDRNTNIDQNFNYKNKLNQADNGHGLGYTFGTDYDPYSGNLWYIEKDKLQGDRDSKLITSLENNLGSIETYDVINDDNFFCIEKIYHDNMHIKRNIENSYKSLVFLDSKALGKSHMNNLFVTSSSNEIMEFDLPKNRNELRLASYQDNVGVDSNDTSLFARGFDKITDLQINPYDGTLYVVDAGSEEEIAGSIYKIDRKIDSDTWFSP